MPGAESRENPKITDHIFGKILCLESENCKKIAISCGVYLDQHDERVRSRNKIQIKYIK